MTSILASAPQDCCFTGVQHTWTPTGTHIHIADVPTYKAEPKHATGTADAPKKVVIFLADVFGPFYINNELLQDFYADNGFTALGIDYFLGDPVHKHEGEEGFDRPAWFAKSRKNAAEVFPKWFEAVKEEFGTEGMQYFAVGYCFGAPYVFDLAAGDLLSAGAVAHPTLLNEHHFDNIKQTDHTFPLDKRRRAEDILVQNKANYHIQVFSGVAHGFAVRGDPSVENSRWAKEESAKSILGWFERFSKAGKALL
ncbi:hypothetical protein HGRIS_011126 [Hohenbuehelia grisea]|uniref:Dienelactone hydrolase domain-containing protein n=1 Tax=Hohenbuehelia grisea TaxID=104357 RepID=A0ABR3IYZ5_9AGAR